VIFDVDAAYRFGNLIDAMITTPDAVNYFKFTVGGEQFSQQEFEKAASMKKSFLSDGFCFDIPESCPLETYNPTLL
jgi:hypothetical protein